MEADALWLEFEAIKKRQATALANKATVGTFLGLDREYLRIYTKLVKLGEAPKLKKKYQNSIKKYGWTK
jgi:hypothetical protein